MEWEGRRESENVEDRRSLTKPALIVGGGGGLLVLILALILGVNPQKLMNLNPGAQQGGDGGAPAATSPEEENLKKFVAVVLADTEDVWNEQFRRMGKTYREPKLVLFRQRVESACGLASAAVGPFYCPGDQKVYLDLSFFDELKRRFKAPGEFAQAYVIAHEIGHHVQNLLGTSARVDEQRGRVSKAEMNKLSVRLELQADFLAGVWAYHAQRTKHILQPGDIESAIRAANAIGDDRLQKQAQGYVVPDSFTHGTSEQRIRWFKKGFQTGDIKQGNTFDVPYGDL
jgi:predicted metalloprotease